MGRKNKNKLNYRKFREKGRSKRSIIDETHLEKIEKVNQRRKLKTGIKLRLKRLTQVINVNSRYLGEGLTN